MGLLLLLSVTGLAFPQEATFTGENSSRLQLGFSMASLRDRTLNNATHSGAGLSSAWSLERSANNSLRIFRLGLGTGFLKSEYETETASFLFSGSASYSWMGYLPASSCCLDIYLGGKGEAKSMIEYFDNWDESHFYWMTAYSAGVVFRIDCSLGAGRKIRIEGDLPMLALVSRPPREFDYTQSSPKLKDVLGDLNHDPDILSLNSYQDLNMEVRYSPGTRGIFKPGLFWRLNFLNLDKRGSESLNLLNQTIGLEYIF